MRAPACAASRAAASPSPYAPGLPSHFPFPSPSLFPDLAEPWLHAAAGLVGAYAGFRIANIYDDTTDTMNRQLAPFAAVPSWAHGQLSAEDLSAELREKRLHELRDKVAALARIEEAEFKAKLAGMSEAELREARAKGAVRFA